MRTMETTEPCKANDLATMMKIDGSVVIRAGISEITGIVTEEVAAAVVVADIKIPSSKAEVADQGIEAAVEEVQEGIGVEVDIGLLTMWPTVRDMGRGMDIRIISRITMMRPAVTGTTPSSRRSELMGGLETAMGITSHTAMEAGCHTNECTFRFVLLGNYQD